MSARALYVLGGCVAAALVFQFFFRYQYEHLGGGRVMRIDRLTSNSCYLPCEPTPEAPATLDRTLESDDQRAIAGVRAGNIGVEPPNDGHDYKWRVWERVSNTGEQHWMKDDMSSDDPTDYPVRLICLCYNDGPGQTTPSGRWWEYHLDTGLMYSVDDNAQLYAKYRMSKTKPQ